MKDEEVRRLAAALVPRFFPAALLLAAVAGCAHTQTLRVVDAQTGQPLGDVWISQGDSPTAAYTLKTDPSGTAQFQKSSSQYGLTKPGYEETRVELSGSVARIRGVSDPAGVEVKRYGDTVQVQLRRQNAPTAKNGIPPDAATMGILARQPVSPGTASR